MKKKNKKTLMLLGILVFILLTVTVVYAFKNFKINNDDIPDNKVVELDKIKEYGYILEDRDTDLFKIVFKELDMELMNEEVDYQKYAELLAKLYIIDLYTINNKISQYDVGSLEFILPETKENFSLKVRNTIYKYLIDNSDNKRTQELPEVSSIETAGIEEKKIKLNEQEYEGYEISLSWEYKKDLKYDTKAKIQIIKKEKMLYIIKQEHIEWFFI